MPPTTPNPYSTYFVCPVLHLQFVCKMENPRFRGEAVTFHDDDERVVVTMYPHEGTGMPTLPMQDERRGFVLGLEFTVQDSVRWGQFSPR